MINIFTDGACSGNPGPGGWGMVVFKNAETIISHNYGHSETTTNNREELKAIISALKYCELNKEETYVIHSDSAYCVNMINDWIYKWYHNGWKRAKNKDIENLDLVQELYKYLNTDFYRNQIKVEKVQGHKGIIGNEMADWLATGKIDYFEWYGINNNYINYIPTFIPM